MRKKYIAAGIVTAGIITLLSVSIVFTTNMAKQLGKIDSKIDKAIGITEDIAQEDDVIIASEYKIKSTKELSDAYVNGTVEKLKSEDKETIDLADKILKEITKDNMTDYEKELAVYQWMIKNIKIDESGMAAVQKKKDELSTPNGVLKNQKAVCVGYATTFRLFMQMMKIDCKVVHSMDLSHSWNEVKLEDDWYFVDAYSDVNSENFANFNLNDEMCLESYEWNREFFPAAAGVKYNYACMNNQKETDVYKISKRVRKVIDDKSENLFLNLGKNMSDETKDIVEAMMLSIEDYTMDSVMISYKWVENDEQERILCIYATPEATEDMENLSDEVAKKVRKAVNKAFEDYSNPDDIDE